MIRLSMLSRRRSFSALFLPLLLMVSGLAPRAAAALSVELEGRYWSADLDGRVSGPLADPTLGVDLGQDLGLDTDEVVEGRFTFRPGLGLFARVAYLTVSVTGVTDLGVEVGGVPIPIDGRLSSLLDLEYGRAALGWQFVSPKKILRIGPYVEAKGLRGDATVTLELPFVAELLREDFEAAFASAGGLVEIQPIDKLQIFADASVLVGEDEADLTDAEVGVRYFPLAILGVGGGYRSVSIDGQIDEVRLDIDWSGFFVTALLRF